MRKVIITAVLAILLFMTYEAVIHGSGLLNATEYLGLKEASDSLQANIGILEQKNTMEYDAKRVELNAAVQEYNSKKQEYETLAAEQKQLAYESTDLYDIDFLWTKIGNYATNRDVVIKFDVVEVVSGMAATDEYKVCDLEFSCIGAYTDITNFIYDIEDDDRFKFEITEFAMIKPKVEEVVTVYPDNTPEEVIRQKVKATFKVKNLPINADTITTTSGQEGSESSTQEIMELVP